MRSVLARKIIPDLIRLESNSMIHHLDDYGHRSLINSPSTGWGRSRPSEDRKQPRVMGLLGVAVAVLLSTSAAASHYEKGNPTTCDTSVAERAAWSRAALNDLEDDFDIIEGKLSFPNFVQPAGRYGLVNFNGAEANPPVLCALTSNVNTPYGPALCNYSFVLGPQDAIVGLFCTPPPVRYFSIRSYTGFRFRPRPWLPAAELGDPINNEVINSTAGVEGGNDEDGPFGKTALFISAGDGFTARKTRHAFVKAGFPEQAINLDVLASEKAYFRDRSKPWIFDRSDAFVINYRVSSVINRTEVEPYFTSSWPFYLLKAKVKKSLRPGLPLTTPPLRPRGDGQPEDALLEPLGKLENAVVDYMEKTRGATLKKRWPMEHIIPDTKSCLTDPNYYPIVEAIPEWNLTGFATCGFFTRDSLYTFMPQPDEGITDYNDLIFPANRTYVFLGSNQVVLGKASYSNIFMTAVAAPQAVGRTFNYSSPDLIGSAGYYLPELGDDADQLFALTLTRDGCDKAGAEKEPFCTTVTESNFNYTEFVYVVERKYLEPSTRIGPAPEEVIPPLILVFESPSSASSIADEAKERGTSVE